jgi:molybdopterin molybdotransferase
MRRHCPRVNGVVKLCALDPRFPLRQKHRMVSDHPSPQRIARLAPLPDVLAWINANVRAVPPNDVSVADAIGRTLAADIKIAHAIPPKAISLRDGYALQSDWTSDASAYAPAPLPQMPARVDVGEALPADTDCVVAVDHVTIKGERAEALAVVAPGEGILPVGGDAAAGQTLLGAGKKLSASDVALLRLASISKVSIRTPRVSVVQTRKSDAIMASAAQVIAAAINKNGGSVVSEERDADAVISIGGTGAGRNDVAVTALARAGKVAFHGIGLMPGETAAIGDANGRPVLLIPGRIDATLACWLVLGRRMFARLAGGAMDDATTPLKLTRKITSTIGIADVILLKSHGGEAEPLASGYWPMQALAQANSYYVVPPESEGFPAGSTVNASPLP